MEDLRIWVSGSDDSQRESLTQTLTGAGFRVESVNPDDLEEALTRQQPSLLLYEISDAPASSLLAIQRMRQQPAMHRLPVILCRRHASEIERTVGLEAGADDYITTPCSAAELSARIKAVMRRAQREQAHRHS